MLDYRTETFLQLYKQMNYRKTAEILGMTQPGVTQHIQFLEQHYGVKLFVYDGRQLHRTPQAEALKRHIDGVLARERSLQQAMAAPEGIRLEVGATKTIGEFVLPPVLEAFLEDPSHSIRFVIDNTENLLQQLEDTRLDFAVIEGVFDRKKYGHRLYKKEQFVGICGADHPFAGKTVPLDQVFRQTLVVREPGSGTRRLLEQAVQDRGYGLECFRRCISVSNFSVISGLVARGHGITFAYTPVAVRRQDLAVFQVEDMALAGEFRFVYCDEEAAERKIRQFFGWREP